MVESMGKVELLLCYDILGCIVLTCEFDNVYVLFFSIFILLIFVGGFFLLGVEFLYIFGLIRWGGN